MNTVLRIEHLESKEGCYRHGRNRIASCNPSHTVKKFYEMLNDHAISNNHLSPFGDEKLKHRMQSNELCGFANAEQACAWFTDEEFVMLFSLGFELIEVEAKNIKYGEQQVVFEKA